MIKIGQYDCIKETAGSEFNILPRDMASNIPYKIHMFIFPWAPSLGFIEYLEHLKFLEYLPGGEHEGLGVQMAENQY